MTKIGKATIANNLHINGDFILEFDFKIVIIPVIKEMTIYDIKKLDAQFKILINPSILDTLCRIKLSTLYKKEIMIPK